MTHLRLNFDTVPWHIQIHSQMNECAFSSENANDSFAFIGESEPSNQQIDNFSRFESPEEKLISEEKESRRIKQITNNIPNNLTVNTIDNDRIRIFVNDILLTTDNDCGFIYNFIEKGNSFSKDLNKYISCDSKLLNKITQINKEKMVDLCLEKELVDIILSYKRDLEIHDLYIRLKNINLYFKDFFQIEKRYALFDCLKHDIYKYDINKDIKYYKRLLLNDDFSEIPSGLISGIDTMDVDMRMYIVGKCYSFNKVLFVIPTLVKGCLIYKNEYIYYVDYMKTFILLFLN